MKTLSELAAGSPSREEMVARGFRGLAKSSDMHKVGYQIQHWLIPGEAGSEVIEYSPINNVHWQTKERQQNDLPRIVVSCYADQARLHVALGLNLVGPGDQWKNYGSKGLFDEQLLQEGEANAVSDMRPHDGEPGD